MQFLGVLPGQLVILQTLGSQERQLRVLESGSFTFLAVRASGPPAGLW